jgi:hypothetical protein
MLREGGKEDSEKLANGLALIFLMVCILLMASLSHTHSAGSCRVGGNLTNSIPLIIALHL